MKSVGEGTTKDRDFIRNIPISTLLSNVASRTLRKSVKCLNH